MCYPFEEGWANKVRSIDLKKVTLSTDERLRAILGRFREWELFPNPSPAGITWSKSHNCDVYFYFLWTQPVRNHDENAYIGFLAPKIYEEIHPGQSSPGLYPVELVFYIKSEYNFNPSRGPYRRAYIPGAGEIWILEFKEDWNCKDIWWEKTKAIRAINSPNCGLHLTPLRGAGEAGR